MPSTSASTRPSASPARGIPSLKGDSRNAWAFAPLAHPERVTVEGWVWSHKAYSTSKVLVVAAFLDTVVGGDPTRLTARQRDLVRRTLTESDGGALLELQGAIPGGAGTAIRAILRGIGDSTTAVPDRTFGGMLWSPREQVRFLCALAGGRVASPAASAYLLAEMRPVRAHAWGLGTIGASAFKGGWLTPSTVTRQMGVVDGYAVAIITAAVGPAVVQSDGDAAHVQQMDVLAGMLKRRLAAER